MTGLQSKKEPIRPDHIICLRYSVKNNLFNQIIWINLSHEY